MVRRRLRDPRLHRKNLSAKGLHVPPGDKFPASAVHYVQLLAALLVIRVGVVVAVNALQLPSGGLVPQLLLPGRGPAVGDLLAGRWRGGGEPSLEDCSRRPLTRFASFWISRQSAALWRAVGCTGHDPPLPPCGRGRFPCVFWPPAAAAAAGAAAAGAATATTGPPGCDSPRLRFFFFFFLPPP